MGNVANRYLLDRSDISFEKKVIVLCLTPHFLLDKTVVESELDTGNRLMDQIVYSRLSEYSQTIEDIILSHLGYQSDSVTMIANNYYAIIRKADGSIFDQSDAERISRVFGTSNPPYEVPTILTSTEAKNTSYFDGVGDIELVFIVSQIDYL